MDPLIIRHIIVLPESVSNDNCSFFQGFSKEVLDDYLEIFTTLIYIPHNVMDCFSADIKRIFFKVTLASLEIQLIREDVADGNHVDLHNEINVLWSTKKTIKSACKLAEMFHNKPIHISTAIHEGTVNILDLTTDTFNHLLYSVLAELRSSCSAKELSGFLENLLKAGFPKIEEKKLPIRPLIHNCTAPLLCALESTGYYADEFIKIEPEASIEQHLDGIISLTKLIDNIRDECHIPSTYVNNDAIVFCPSMYAHLYNKNDRRWKKLNRELSKIGRNLLTTALIRNRGYGNCQIHCDVEFTNPYQIEYLGILLHERQKELSLFTAIVGIIGGSQFCPAIRLPNSVMLHHDKLKNISSLITSSNQDKFKILNKKISAYSNAIKDDIGISLLDLLFKDRNKLFCICDLPIEWLNFGGVPIMFTHEISKIPSTPGNLIAQLGLNGMKLHLGHKALLDILIIRSFENSDPLKRNIEIAIKSLEQFEYTKNLHIRLVDVSTQEELVEILNAFAGVIVIFDCHGNHGGTNEHGWLQIGKEKVDLWDLATKCKIPSIVILSACSTHAIDGSHASVANGLLACGAISVIGTYAPIAADHAAQFVARLLLRISGFIPLLTKRRPTTWREIVSGFFKMSYSTDVLRGLCYELKILPENIYNEVHSKANIFINSGDHLWIEQFKQLIGEGTGLNDLEVIDILQEEFQFVETMLYTQLGRPENILIYYDEMLITDTNSTVITSD